MGILKSIGKFLKKLLCNCKCKCSSLCEIDFNSVEKPNETKDHVVETIQTDYCPSCASNSPRVSPRNSPRVSPRNSPRVSPRNSPRVSPRNSPRVSPRVSPRNSPTEFNKPVSESPTPIYVSLM